MGKLRDGIIKRGTKWYYVIRVTDHETGLSKPRWVGGFATEGEAKAERDEARVNVRRGDYVGRNRMTVTEYFLEWLDAHAVEIKPKTLAGYRDLVARYVLPRVGAMRLQAVRAATLTKLYRDLMEAGGKDGRPLSHRTVDQVHAIVRKALTDAVRVDEVLASNPAERAKRPRRTRKPVGSVWSTKELRAFLRTASKHRLSAFFHLAAYSGARRGELLNLRWSDVDFGRSEITIRGSAAVVEGQRLEGTTKGGRERTVSIDARTVRILKEHRSNQVEERLVAGPSWNGDDHVFTTALGSPIFPDTVSHLMPKLIAAHNEGKDGSIRSAVPLPLARLHDLRHVHATTLLLAGVPVHVVAERLGHADPSITLRVYAHVIRQQVADVAEVFARQVDVDEVLDDHDPPAASST
jgi:integrase